MKNLFSLTIIFAVLRFCWSQDYMFDYEPVSKISGFKMAGHWIWGGSYIFQEVVIVEEDGKNSWSQSVKIKNPITIV